MTVENEPKEGGAPGEGQPGADKGDGTGSGELGKLTERMNALESIPGSVQALEQTVNLIRDAVLAGQSKEGAPKTEVDKGGPKGLDSYNFDQMTNTEMVKAISTEFNKVLKDMHGNFQKTFEHISVDLDIMGAIGRISSEEGIPFREAHKRFWALEKELLEAAGKFEDIKAYDAYKYVSGSKPPPKKDEGEDRRIDPKRLAEELRGGGTKPGGTTDVTPVTPKTIREAASKSYEEFFEKK